TTTKTPTTTVKTTVAQPTQSLGGKSLIVTVNKILIHNRTVSSLSVHRTTTKTPTTTVKTTVAQPTQSLHGKSLRVTVNKILIHNRTVSSLSDHRTVLVFVWVLEMMFLMSVLGGFHIYARIRKNQIKREEESLLSRVPECRFTLSYPCYGAVGHPLHLQLRREAQLTLKKYTHGAPPAIIFKFNRQKITHNPPEAQGVCVGVALGDHHPAVPVSVSNKVASERKHKVSVSNKVASEWKRKVGVSNKVASERKHKVGVSNKVASEWKPKVSVSNKVASEWKHKVGVSNKVASERKQKVGVSNKVASERKHKVGVSNKVASEWKHKVGVSNKVASEWKHKVGVSNKVASERKHKVGVSNKVASERKHKVGVSNKVASEWKHKVGVSNKVASEWKHKVGVSNKVARTYSKVILEEGKGHSIQMDGYRKPRTFYELISPPYMTTENAETTTVVGWWAVQSVSFLLPSVVSSVEVTEDCSSSENRRVYCSSDGDDVSYSWTFQHPHHQSDGNQTLLLDNEALGRLTCSAQNHVSRGNKTIELHHCTGFRVFVSVWLLEIIILLSLLVGAFYIYTRIYQKQRAAQSLLTRVPVCMFNQTDVCYGAVGHPLYLQLRPEYELGLKKKHNESVTERIFRFNNQHITQNHPDYLRWQFVPDNKTVIINRTEKRDSGSYTLDTYDSGGAARGSYPLQLVTEDVVSSVKVTFSCISIEKRRVYCSSDGEGVTYSWTFRGTPHTDQPADGNQTLLLDKESVGSVTCYAQNHVSRGNKTIQLDPCPGKSGLFKAVKPALICEKHKAPEADLPILVFCGKCQSSSTVLTYTVFVRVWVLEMMFLMSVLGGFHIYARIRRNQIKREEGTKEKVEKVEKALYTNMGQEGNQRDG
ncbi:hypothetical protein NFI96_021137, partial [Prochilodus magdalenae]